MKSIAVIGSGISGMAAAYLLSQRYDVTLYEKNPVPGGHTRTKLVNFPDKTIAVDTGFIVFNHVTYPELLGMFRHLNVATEKSNMSFGFTADQGRFEWGAESLSAVFGQKSNLLNPRFYRMIWDVARFFREAESRAKVNPDATLEQMLDSMGLGQGFRERFLLPMGAAIWNCPAKQMLEFPAQTFVQFFINHGLMSFTNQHQWYTVSGGSQRYIDKILAPLKGKIRLSASVRTVLRHENSITVELKNGEKATHDSVVIAAHADEALAMLKDASLNEKSVLGAFTYQKNIAYLHNDERVMPKRKVCWSSWNYYSQKNSQLFVTYWMNKLQNIGKDYPLFVSLNPSFEIDESKTFDRHEFAHPVFTREAIQAQSRIPSIQGRGNIWFCGAYQRYGFHEDGLQSAVKVATSLGVTVPWH